MQAAVHLFSLLVTKPTFSSLQLTPWDRDLLENVTVTQRLKKFPAFNGTRRFITAFTRARHWFLSWARWIQSTISHPISL